MQKVRITHVYNSVKGGDIRWEKTPGASGYVVYRQRSAEGIKKIATIRNVNTLQCYDTGIKDKCWGRVYHYYIRALYGTKEGPAGGKLALQRLAPVKITACQSLQAGSASLKWECTVKENKALGYQIQYAQSKEDLFGRKGSFRTVTVSGRKNTGKVIKGLSKGKTYYFRIRCYVNYTHSITGQLTKTWSQYSNVKGVRIR